MSFNIAAGGNEWGPTKGQQLNSPDFLAFLLEIVWFLYWIFLAKKQCNKNSVQNKMCAWFGWDILQVRQRLSSLLIYSMSASPRMLHPNIISTFTTSIRESPMLFYEHVCTWLHNWQRWSLVAGLPSQKLTCMTSWSWLYYYYYSHSISQPSEM